MSRTEKQPQGECIRCGQCMAVCPVYEATRMECDVARGRLSVLKRAQGDDSLIRSGIARDVLSRCLLCGACENTCANKVPVVRKVLEARTGAGKKYGLGQQIQLAALTDPGLIGEVLRKGGRLAQGLMGSRIPRTSGLHVRFPLDFFSGRGVIPALAPAPWLDGDHKPPSSAKGPRVGFFLGCGANHIFHDAADALERLAALAGVQLIAVQGQGCCGLPAYASGDAAGARACAEKNLDAFFAQDLDAVVTVCASCGSHLLQLSQLFEPGSRHYEMAGRLREMHCDAAHMLLGRAPLQNLLSKGMETVLAQGPRVYYHTPCHLRFGPGASNAPFDLLKALAPRVDLIPLQGLTHCCGHGGGFNIRHHALSMDIHGAYLSAVLDKHPQYVVTGCTGCLLQFTEGIYHSGCPNVELCHPLVLAEKMLGLGANP